MAQRIQITVSFTYEQSVFVAATSGGSATTAATLLLPATGSTVTVTNRVTQTPAIVYASATGPTTLSPVITDAGGNVPGYLPEGSYTIQAAASGAFSGATVNWEAAYGAGVANVASNAVDTPQLSTAVQNELTLYGPPTPVGSMIHYAGSNDPIDSDGTKRWMVCDGRAISRTTYANLFTAISTTYGTGDGSTTFNIPDMRSRFGVGAQQGTGLTNRPLGQYGGGTLDTNNPKRGEETHVLSEAELASHSHGGATGSGTTNTVSTDHYHTGETNNNYCTSGYYFPYNTSAGVGWDEFLAAAGSAGCAHTPGGWTGSAQGYHGHSFTTAYQSGSGFGNYVHSHTQNPLGINPDGSNVAHNNMPPYLAVNFIVKVL